MGPGGEGGGVHEVRRERGVANCYERTRDELVLGEDELKRETKRIVETKRDYYNIR